MLIRVPWTGACCWALFTVAARVMETTLSPGVLA
jgi:hypothetical protein